MAFQGQKLKTKVVKTFGVLQSFLLPTPFIPDFVLFLVLFLIPPPPLSWRVCLLTSLLVAFPGNPKKAINTLHVHIYIHIPV